MLFGDHLSSNCLFPFVLRINFVLIYHHFNSKEMALIDLPQVVQVVNDAAGIFLDSKSFHCILYTIYRLHNIFILYTIIILVIINLTDYNFGLLNYNIKILILKYTCNCSIFT